MSWEEWMIIHNQSPDKNRMDLLIELAVSSYELDKRSRKAELKDKVQFFIKWWYERRGFMLKYKTLESVAKLMSVDHATVLHHIKRRKPTAMYEENSRCLNDFLNS